MDGGTLLNNITSLLERTAGSSLLHVLDLLTQELNFGDIVLTLLTKLVQLLPMSPLQALIVLINWEDAALFAKIFNFVNYIIPFDIFVAILEVYIPFLLALQVFRLSWGNIFKLVNKAVFK